MKYLLDTHILLWMLFEPEKLSKKVKKILKDESNEIFASVISLWEISLKYQLNKLLIDSIEPEEILQALKEADINIKELSPESALTFYKLTKKSHKDPFDRMLIWEAIRNNYIFLSKDRALEEYKKEGLKYIF